MSFILINATHCFGSFTLLTIFSKCNYNRVFSIYNIYNIYFVHLIKKYSFSNKYSTIINKQFQFMQYTSLVNT